MQYRYDVQQLMDMRITFRDMLTGQIRQVPISAVAKEEYTTTFSAIKAQGPGPRGHGEQQRDRGVQQQRSGATDQG
jgi:hypothetical protein